MFAALIKAAIFYFIFIQIRKLLRNSGVLSGSKPSAQRKHHDVHSTYSQQDEQQSVNSNDKDIIEADYRVID
ncbi:hypothetical protein M902_2957 [Bacteriovorax sp. BAL6_X]|uniref:hypothetical protein n=1 Tax=Bacteriovorax sp. BAL6_X TaxID=1201290 RepID=UPI000386A1B6|nr:hypothetical protein [Bacteriovorax sp. BAL6_X]EPZ51237.1 hypothetical protein M902_2957 [Bacteriovorax sp. BAL6_X]